MVKSPCNMLTLVFSLLPIADDESAALVVVVNVKVSAVPCVLACKDLTASWVVGAVLWIPVVASGPIEMVWWGCRQPKGEINGEVLSEASSW